MHAIKDSHSIESQNVTSKSEQVIAPHNQLADDHEIIQVSTQGYFVEIIFLLNTAILRS